MDSFALVIFGITGNLAQIKLIPALYDMAEKGLLPKNMSIIGIARKVMNKNDFIKYFHQTLNSQNIHHQHPIKEDVFRKLSEKLHYIDGHLDNPSFYKNLKAYMDKKGYENKIYYLATYPDLYSHVFENLQKLGMNKQQDGWVRLMIEKPIGNDLKSAKNLNQL